MTRPAALVTEALAVLARSPALGPDAALRAAARRIGHSPSDLATAESVLLARVCRKIDAPAEPFRLRCY